MPTAESGVERGDAGYVSVPDGDQVELAERQKEDVEVVGQID